MQLIAATAGAAVVGYSFTLGLVAVANPCGLPLLPAYLSFFVHQREEAARQRGSMLIDCARAVVASSWVTVGFVAVFAVIGLALGGAAAAVESAVPALMIPAGIVMAVVGVMGAIGRPLRLPLPKRSPRVQRRNPLTMAAFGVFYALASLGCSLPVFLVAVGGTFDQTATWVVVRACMAYALGMGVLLAIIAVVGVVSGGGPPRLIRVAGRIGQPLAGALLALSGTYLSYYWAESLARPDHSPALVAVVDHVQAALSRWLDANAWALGISAGAAVVALLVAAGLSSRPRTNASGTPTR